MILLTKRVRFTDEIGDLDDDLSFDLEDFTVIPTTLKVSIIDRFEPSALDDAWTDVYLIDGEQIVIAENYAEFLLQFQIASKLNVDETWKAQRSKDGEIQIRTYLN